MKSTRIKLIALGLALALAWGFFLATMGRVKVVGELRPPALDPIPVIESADFDWTLEDLSGKPVKLADFKGRPIVLNFWASWCEPCLMEMPSLARLAENPRVKATNAAILCVSTDSSSEAVREFLKDKPWKLTMLRATSSPKVFLTDTIPATFLIDRDGRIVNIEIGAVLWDDPTVVDYIEKLK